MYVFESNSSGDFTNNSYQFTSKQFTTCLRECAFARKQLCLFTMSPVIQDYLLKAIFYLNRGRFYLKCEVILHRKNVYHGTKRNFLWNPPPETISLNAILINADQKFENAGKI